MKVLIMILVVLLATGCRSYGVEKGVDAAGNEYVKVNVTSSADLEDPSVFYEKKDGSVKFTFAASNVDSNTEEFMSMFQGMVMTIMEMWKASMMMQAGATPQ